MPEKEQRDTTRPVGLDRERTAADATLEVSAEQQEWFRLAGFTRTEWQRLVYMRWLYRQGELTEYPQGR